MAVEIRGISRNPDECLDCSSCLPDNRWRFLGRDKNLTDNANEPMGAQSSDERIPFMQQLLDNPFLLLFLGVATPTVLYIVWGIMEVASVPIAN